MKDQDLYELCKATAVRLNKTTGNLEISADTAADMVEALKANKTEIVDALSGYCFSHDAYVGHNLHTWKVVKASTVASVYYTPVTVFEGTAREVDDWARANRKDPFFSDRYTSKYSFCIAD